MVSSEVDLRVVNERRMRFVAREEAMEEARERQFDFSDANRGPRVSRLRPSTYTFTLHRRRRRCYPSTMTSSYRRIDTTDPRRHDRVRPMKLPAAWLDDSIDVYGVYIYLSLMSFSSPCPHCTERPHSH